MFGSLQNALGYHGDKGLLSSLMGWIVAGNVTPSFIESNALTGEVCVLCCVFASFIKTTYPLYGMIQKSYDVLLHMSVCRCGSLG